MSTPTTVNVGILRYMYITYKTRMAIKKSIYYADFYLNIRLKSPIVSVNRSFNFVSIFSMKKYK